MLAIADKTPVKHPQDFVKIAEKLRVTGYESGDFPL
jgi:hypothetical protein